ncbi:MAG: ArsR family transcriptional regulator, partial [Chloroflexi bacterium]|nr:ArsR family transcriptional regulator [Chloroflexota bacterium]
MARRGSEIPDFLFENVEAHPTDIVHFAAAHFEVTRQSVAKHMKELVSGGLISAEGNTRARTYRINSFIVPLVDIPILEEDVI